MHHQTWVFRLMNSYQWYFKLRKEICRVKKKKKYKKVQEKPNSQGNFPRILPVSKLLSDTKEENFKIQNTWNNESRRTIYLAPYDNRECYKEKEKIKLWCRSLKCIHETMIICTKFCLSLFHFFNHGKIREKYLKRK